MSNFSPSDLRDPEPPASGRAANAPTSPSASPP